VSGRSERHDLEHEKVPADPRSPYQRDRDRLLYAPELRRLAAVTQVAASHETQLFHNRLTHTIKVAQFARRLAERLASSAAEVDPDVCEAAALAHDIGHPPFGHIAEEELDRLMTQGGAPDGFEGNAQSFRIVTHLATHTSGTPGLNLTRAALQALTKYPWERATTGKKHRKYGSYADESAIFAWTRESLSSDRQSRQTAEATIMDWADDVAYALHDLEDFYAAGLVPLDRLARDTVLQANFLQRTRERWAEQKREVTDAEWHAHEEIAQNLFAEFPAEREPSHLMRRMSASKANLFATGLTIVDGRAVEDPDMRMQLDLLKSLTWTYVIESPALAAQQAGQKRLIQQLFEYFTDAASSSPHALPHWAQRVAAEAQTDDDRLRVACDVVASLTEAQAAAVFARISGANPGSILDTMPA
jgi:dGTPase